MDDALGGGSAERAASASNAAASRGHRCVSRAAAAPAAGKIQ
jgi:hypothetical protein